jgi:hypothetical protein
MNVKIEADAVLFPEKEYISGIFVALYYYPHTGEVTPHYN